MQGTTGIKRALVGGMAAVVAAGLMLTGCSTAPTTTATAGGASGSAAVATKSAGSGSTSTSTTKTGMSTTGAAHTVKDASGNEVSIPASVSKVAPTTGALAEITELLTQNGKLVAAAPTAQITDSFAKIFPAYKGSNADGNDAATVEGILASGAKVAYGPAGQFNDDQVQQLKNGGVAYVALAPASTPDAVCDNITTVGDILGGEAKSRAKEFVSYYQDQVKAAQKDTGKKTTAGKQVTAVMLASQNGQYYVAGKESLIGSAMQEAGVTDLAAEYTSDQKSADGSLDQVSVDQITQWNPDLIIAADPASFTAIWNDKALAKVTAVASNVAQQGSLRTLPQGVVPLASPAGVSCLLPAWIGEVAYPEDRTDVDTTKLVQEFYQKWYGAKLSEHDAESFVSGEW